MTSASTKSEHETLLAARCDITRRLEKITDDIRALSNWHDKKQIEYTTKLSFLQNLEEFAIVDEYKVTKFHETYQKVASDFQHKTTALQQERELTIKARHENESKLRLISCTVQLFDSDCGEVIGPCYKPCVSGFAMCEMHLRLDKAGKIALCQVNSCDEQAEEKSQYCANHTKPYHCLVESRYGQKRRCADIES